jgi:threonine synthase
MEYISLGNPNRIYTFKEVVLKSIADDGSLFVPKFIPRLDTSFLRNQKYFDLKATAFHVLKPFIQDTLGDDELKEIIDHTFSFPLDIIQMDDDLFVETLYRGPTHAFKDIGARFLAGCLKQWLTAEERITVLVATSGDTGGAVAHAFHGIKNIRVVILYPKGKVSAYQEQQIAGLGDNIEAVAVSGNFDDCQRLVKQAFADQDLSREHRLTSSNSINIGRWLPQMLFYATAWHWMERSNIDKNIIVPSGNYGNIAAGLLFHMMGFHFKELIAAHNENDTIPRYLLSQQYQPHATKHTFANAMDVSDPSNFVRFKYLMSRERENPIRFSAQSVSDENILSAIRECWKQNGFLIDPHTATAYSITKSKGIKGTILATADPYKFKEVIIKALGHFPKDWELPEEKGVEYETMENSFAAFKEFLTRP